jgi:hypothetical protein
MIFLISRMSKAFDKYLGRGFKKKKLLIKEHKLDLVQPSPSGYVNSRRQMLPTGQVCGFDRRTDEPINMSFTF